MFCIEIRGKSVVTVLFLKVVFICVVIGILRVGLYDFLLDEAILE